MCSVERAFLLLFSQKAENVEILEGSVVRSVTRSFSVPSIIRLVRYVNVPYKGVMLSKNNVFKRDASSCQYCGSGRNLTLDHVIPRSRGGQTKWTNLVTACSPCNSVKGNRTPKEAQMPLRRQPFRPSFLLLLKISGGSSYERWRPYLERG